MTSLLPRLLLVAVILVVVQAGVLLIGRNYEPGEVVIPDRQLSSMPMQFADWRGQETELDPKIFRSLGAFSVINRRYSDAAGHEALLHAVLSETYTDRVPHYPQVCYPSNGWKILKQEDLAVGDSQTGTAHARLFVAEQNGQNILVLYWYQFGESTFVDRDGFREARREFWGKDKWPPVIKVMLQAPAVPDKKEAQARLSEFAADVWAWTKDVK